MNRGTLLALAMGGLVIAGTPFAANAQSMNSPMPSSAIGEANLTCSSYGLDPRTLGYRSCVDNELTRTGATTTQAITVPDDQPHVAVSHDQYDFGYDSQGNLLDSKGYVIRPVPISP